MKNIFCETRLISFYKRLSLVKNLTVLSLNAFRLILDIHLSSINVFEAHWDPHMRSTVFHECKNSLTLSQTSENFQKKILILWQPTICYGIYYIACNKSLGSVASGRVARMALVIPILNPTTGSLQGCTDTCCMPGSTLFKDSLWTGWTDLESKNSFRMNNERISISP